MYSIVRYSVCNHQKQVDGMSWQRVVECDDAGVSARQQCQSRVFFLVRKSKILMRDDLPKSTEYRSVAWVGGGGRAGRKKHFMSRPCSRAEDQ